MKQHNIFKIISLLLLSLTGVVLIGLQNQLGWWTLGLWILSLIGCKKDFAKDLALIYLSLIILSISKINTDISYYHMIEMGATLTLALGLPYVISKYYYKSNSIDFRFFSGQPWTRKEIMYIFLSGVIAYLLIPFYLKNTGAYLNWSIEPGVSNMIRLFVWTNALWIWDELFFISTVLWVLRKHLPFIWANILQAILFSAFLYELWFTGWWFIMIYIFALIQWIIFKKTESLAYVITIHLVVDFILFLALIQAHHPNWMPIFVT